MLNSEARDVVGERHYAERSPCSRSQLSVRLIPSSTLDRGRPVEELACLGDRVRAAPQGEVADAGGRHLVHRSAQARNGALGRGGGEREPVGTPGTPRRPSMRA